LGGIEDMDHKIKAVTRRIKERSQKLRSEYIGLMTNESHSSVTRNGLACGNLAHAFAACSDDEKLSLSGESKPNFGIITSYNDMLSAHKTYEDYPKLLREAARKHGAVAQVASGVPAMCDGVTQGQAGMELSLLSRDVIALSTAIGMSHKMFDGGLCLGICDKIVPGMLIGSLRFGHLPFIFIPGGPMESGISNEEKAKHRRDYAEGKISRKELLKAESASYHSAGTCTFYGTANSNQMLMEMLGVHLPGSSFVTPNTPLRQALNEFAVQRLTEIINQKEEYTPLYEVITVESIVNALVGLVATGGSTNHTLHLIAIARAAGIILDWQDFNDVSEAVPSIVRIYPNGSADINHFQACGGMGFLIKTLRNGGYLNENVKTIMGSGLEHYTKEPQLQGTEVVWKESPKESLDKNVLRSVDEAFNPTGGLKILNGNLGRSVVKISAVKEEHYVVRARAQVFSDQNKVVEAFKRKELNKDVIVVVKNQGPQANGMPELHKLTPSLSILQNQGFKVALVTDGRMSGASGKIPAAIHLTPESMNGGPIAKIQSGDLLEFNANTGQLNCLENGFTDRTIEQQNIIGQQGVGRELFAQIRPLISQSELGASFII
jgi:phosphogluconate dehydratase